MPTGQMLLVIAAFAALSGVALSVQQTLGEAVAVSVTARQSGTGIGLCQAKLEETAFLEFDLLETVAGADTVATPLGTFVRTAEVDFVEASAPDSSVEAPTRFKRILVTLVPEEGGEAVRMRVIAGRY